MDCDIHIVAFDVSKALIRQAIARYQEGNHRARAVFFAADVSRFPFRDETFDTVLVYGVLHHLADPAAACREISRVLKPQGSYFGQENNRTVFTACSTFSKGCGPSGTRRPAPRRSYRASSYGHGSVRHRSRSVAIDEDWSAVRFRRAEFIKRST